MPQQQQPLLRIPISATHSPTKRFRFCFSLRHCSQNDLLACLLFLFLLPCSPLPIFGYAQLCLWLCGFCFGLHLRFDWQLTEMFVDTQSALRLFYGWVYKNANGAYTYSLEFTTYCQLVRLYDSIANEILGLN